MTTHQLIEIIEPYYGTSVCCDDDLNILKKISFYQYDKISSMLFCQESMREYVPTYTLYKIDLITHICTHHLDILTNIGNAHHTTLQANDNFIMLHTLSHETLLTMLSDHNSDKYFIIPIMFGSEIGKNGHCSALIFDLMNNKVYFIDPNGRTTYFDNLIIDMLKTQETTLEIDTSDLMIPSEYLVETLFTTYISEFNKNCNTKFEFVERRMWNSTAISLNKEFTNSSIGTGHCVILTIMICHILKLSQTYPKKVIDSLCSISDEVLMGIINNYSFGIIDIIKQLK